VGGARKPQPGDGCLRHLICPGTACPETVLVGRMTDGSYLLMAHPGLEPAAFVVRADADLLYEALQAAFGPPTTGVGGESDTAAREDTALSTKWMQP
jgi:hypothetical protein